MDGRHWCQCGPRRSRYLDSLRANGGTNIQGALEEALALAPPPGRLPLVLFLTDGEPTVSGETRAGRRSRSPTTPAVPRGDRRPVHVRHQGADVNAALLEAEDRVAGTWHRDVRQAGRVKVERAVGMVADRLTRPVATDVDLINSRWMARRRVRRAAERANRPVCRSRTSWSWRATPGVRKNERDDHHRRAKARTVRCGGRGRRRFRRGSTEECVRRRAAVGRFSLESAT